MNAIVIDTDRVSKTHYQDFGSELQLFSSDEARNKKMRKNLQWVTITGNHHLK